VSGSTIEEAAAQEPRYWPVLERETGRVVGAELLRTSAPASVAARSFAFGTPAREDWWLVLGPHPGSVLGPSAATGVRSLLRESGLEPERLVLRVPEVDLAHAVADGTVAAITRSGVRFAVEICLAGLDVARTADVAAVRAAVGRVASVDSLIIGVDVETDAQVALAGECGIGFVQGYGWGSPGSLDKLVHTWARQPVTG